MTNGQNENRQFGTYMREIGKRPQIGNNGKYNHHIHTAKYYSSQTRTTSTQNMKRNVYK